VEERWLGEIQASKNSLAGFAGAGQEGGWDISSGGAEKEKQSRRLCIEIADLKGKFGGYVGGVGGVGVGGVGGGVGWGGIGWVLRKRYPLRGGPGGTSHGEITINYYLKSD